MLNVGQHASPLDANHPPNNQKYSLEHLHTGALTRTLWPALLISLAYSAKQTDISTVLYGFKPRNQFTKESFKHLQYIIRKVSTFV